MRVVTTVKINSGEEIGYIAVMQNIIKSGMIEAYSVVVVVVVVVLVLVVVAAAAVTTTTTFTITTIPSLPLPLMAPLPPLSLWCRTK